MHAIHSHIAALIPLTVTGVRAEDAPSPNSPPLSEKGPNYPKEQRGPAYPPTQPNQQSGPSGPSPDAVGWPALQQRDSPQRVQPYQPEISPLQPQQPEPLGQLAPQPQ
jgi:hypothetical protein